MSFATALNRLTGGRLAGQPKGQGQFHSEAAQLLELSHALRDVGSIYWRSIRGHVTLSDEQRESVRGLPLQQKPGVSEIQEWSVHASRSVTFRRGQPVIPLPGGAEQFNLSFVGPSIGYYFTISELGQVIETEAKWEMGEIGSTSSIGEAGVRVLIDIMMPVLIDEFGKEAANPTLPIEVGRE